MASESVTGGMNPYLREELAAIVREAYEGPDGEAIGSARERLAEAIAIQELATRVSGDNEEDFDMLQRASCVTFRLLEEVSGFLHPAQNRARISGLGAE